MTRDEQIKTLTNPKASKEQLREALAASLGVEYEARTKEKAVTLFVKCRDIFMNEYKRQTNVDYSFEAKDGKALTLIINKIGKLENVQSDLDKLNSFNALIYYLPDWYKQNAFSLTVINNKFNEIIASIRKNGNREQQVTSDFKDRVAARIRARQSKY